MQKGSQRTSEEGLVHPQVTTETFILRQNHIPLSENLSGAEPIMKKQPEENLMFVLAGGLP